MPLLLIPLLIGLLLLAWLLLLPLSLWQRYRLGKLRRRAWPWRVKLNAWLLSLSTLLFVAGAWASGHWWPGALRHAALGLAAGVALGCFGIWLSRFERTPRGLYYTPNAWLSLLLTAIVATRIALGAVEMWRRWQDAAALSWIPPFEHASLFAVAGLLLGHYLAYQWGLRWRLLPWSEDPRA